MKRLLSCLALLPAITLAEPAAVPAELEPFDYGKVDLRDFDPETYLKRRR
ncbi:hypothetical protein [Crenobacter cavernae]|nr:hypothetical protein [Crenobacter cavernae]